MPIHASLEEDHFYLCNLATGHCAEVLSDYDCGFILVMCTIEDSESHIRRIKESLKRRAI